MPSGLPSYLLIVAQARLVLAFMQRHVHEAAIVEQAARHGLQPCPHGLPEQTLRQAGFVDGVLRLLSLEHREAVHG